MLKNRNRLSSLKVRIGPCASAAAFNLGRYSPSVISSSNMSLARLLVCLCVLAGCLAGEEGMWTFDNLPVEALERSTGLHRLRNGWSTFACRLFDSAMEARVPSSAPKD